jgi:Resolvase, N terminal domain
VLKTLLDEALPSGDDSRTFHPVYTSAAAPIPQTTVIGHMIRKVVGPGRLSVGRCSRSGVRNQRVALVLVGRLRYTGGVSHLLGYARVSTAERNADLQTDELTAAGCWRVWTDHASGVLDRRPQLDELLGQLRPGDTLVVWRLDRLGRSLRHLIDVVTALDDRGVGFRSLRESIDTTAPGGRLVFHLFGALAQLSVIWTRRDVCLPRWGLAA